MPRPVFNANGDLPPGVHRATLQDVVERFGGLTGARVRCTRNLTHIYDLVQRTGYLHRFIVFGSYVTNKEEPNDIDVILVMNEDFHPVLTTNSSGLRIRQLSVVTDRCLGP